MKCSIEEYNSLREEAIRRVGIFNTNNLNVISVFFALIIGVVSVLIDNKTDSSLIMIMPVIGVLPLLLLAPLTEKSHDNLRQMVNLSSYIRVMYEYPSQVEKGDDIKAWEGFNGLGYYNVPFLKTMNSEYAFFTVWIAVMNCIIGFRVKEQFKNTVVAWVVICLLVAANVYFIVRIFLNSSPYKIFVFYSIEYQIHYLFKANSLKFLDDDFCCDYFGVIIKEYSGKMKANQLEKVIRNALAKEPDGELKDRFRCLFCCGRK